MEEMEKNSDILNRIIPMLKSFIDEKDIMNKKVKAVEYISLEDGLNKFVILRLEELREITRDLKVTYTIL